MQFHKTSYEQPTTFVLIFPKSFGELVFSSEVWLTQKLNTILRKLRGMAMPCGSGEENHRNYSKLVAMNTDFTSEILSFH